MRRLVNRLLLVQTVLCALTPVSWADIYEWEYVVPGDPSQGVQLTASGRGIMRKIAILKSPYPILGDHISRGDI